MTEPTVTEPTVTEPTVTEPTVTVPTANGPDPSGAGSGLAATGWHVVRTSGPAGPFHHLQVPEPVRAEVWIHNVTGPALVLGSAQPDGLVDYEGAADAGVEVTRRRSGGGLVALDPADVCWIDLTLPRSSPLWDDDVGAAFTWLGTTWAAALAALLGASPAGPVTVHRGPLLRRAAGRTICFAGLGPGEVSVGGRKVVGLSMRRWRTGARFQCAMVQRWQPDLLDRFVDHVAIAAALSTAGLTLDGVPAGLPDGAPAITPGAVVAAFLEHLPDPRGSAQGSAPKPAEPPNRNLTNGHHG